MRIRILQRKYTGTKKKMTNLPNNGNFGKRKVKIGTKDSNASYITVAQ